MARISTDKLTPEQREEIENDDELGDLENLKPKALLDVVKAVWDKSKGNPLMLLLTALGSGIGGQEGSALFGQQVQWYYIAGGVVVMAMLQWLSEHRKNTGRMVEELINIRGQLKKGARVMSANKDGVDEYRAWRHEIESKGLLPTVKLPPDDDFDDEPEKPASLD